MTRLKQVRLKITSVPCTQSELPVARWLAKEGFLQSESRLDQNRKDLETFNKESSGMAFGCFKCIWVFQIGLTIGPNPTHPPIEIMGGRTDHE